MSVYRPRNHRHARHGIQALELLIVVPLLTILLLAVVEFGLIYLNLRHLAFASRTGTKIAAEQASFDITLIKTEVDRHLRSAGLLSNSQVVVLEHNVGGTYTQISSNPSITCPLPTIALPDATVVPEGCVRVTVCVTVNVLTPDLLATFGLSLASRQATESTLFVYEAL